MAAHRELTDLELSDLLKTEDRAAHILFWVKSLSGLTQRNIKTTNSDNPVQLDRLINRSDDNK
ncbi:hypothetical protein QE439_000009 [Pedobacter agri]|nr:hypothetical protein [Pedobacter agri]